MSSSTTRCIGGLQQRRLCFAAKDEPGELAPAAEDPLPDLVPRAGPVSLVHASAERAAGVARRPQVKNEVGDCDQTIPVEAGRQTESVLDIPRNGGSEHSLAFVFSDSRMVFCAEYSITYRPVPGRAKIRRRQDDRTALHYPVKPLEGLQERGEIRLRRLHHERLSKTRPRNQKLSTPERMPMSAPVYVASSADFTIAASSECPVHRSAANTMSLPITYGSAMP